MSDRMMVQRKKAATPTSTFSTFKSSTHSFIAEPTAASPQTATQARPLSQLSLSRPQAKLKVSQLGDLYEQEADRVAEQVMRMAMPEPVVATATRAAPAVVQRKCSACEVEEERLSRKEGSDTQTTEDATASVSEVLQSGGGQPLDEATRAFMELGVIPVVSTASSGVATGIDLTKAAYHGLTGNSDAASRNLKDASLDAIEKGVSAKAAPLFSDVWAGGVSTERGGMFPNPF